MYNKKRENGHIFLIVLAVIQFIIIVGIIIYILANTNNHSDSYFYCPSSWGCECDTDAEMCDCYYCEDGTMTCDEPLEIECYK